MLLLCFPSRIGLRLANGCLFWTKRAFTIPSTTRSQLGFIGSRYGKLVQALKQPGRRFAHVQYARPESAAAALAALNQKLVRSSWGEGEQEAQLLFAVANHYNQCIGLVWQPQLHVYGPCINRRPLETVQVPELNDQGVLLIEYATPADDRSLGGRPSSSGSGSVPKGGAYGIGGGPGGKANIANSPTTCLWGRRCSGGLPPAWHALAAPGAVMIPGPCCRMLDVGANEGPTAKLHTAWRPQRIAPA